jgi:F-type H+/Na+-transporting ATPase subunit alpha
MNDRERETKDAGTTADLSAVVEHVFSSLHKATKAYTPHLEVHEAGRVLAIAGGVATVGGLSRVQSEELLHFPDNVYGLAFNLDPDGTGVVMLGDGDNIGAGSRVRRTGRVMDIPVGEELLGRVINVLGQPLDGKNSPRASARYQVERDAPAIMDRAPVTVPLETGIKVIDALIPVGRGQRELILGDRQTGKTAIALDTIVNQKGKDVVCVYCSIGRRSSATATLTNDLRKKGAMEHTVIVVAAGEQPPGVRYIAPYAATAIGEYFMDRGRDVLVVYDDLTQHAVAYRELSLLLRRPPGREAYPGDIFYIHSRLLERSTHLRPALGGGSLTALPIVETEAQNVSAYIPTNLISITDGQIYLSPDLFKKGVLPAVDPGKSVSRVGGKTQLPAYQAVAGTLRLSYAQFVELEKFARFSTRLDAATQKDLERGRRVREILKQHRFAPLSPTQQVVCLLAVNAGVFDDMAVGTVRGAEEKIIAAVDDKLADVRDRLHQGEKLTAGDREKILAVARQVVAEQVKPSTDSAGQQG